MPEQNQKSKTPPTADEVLRRMLATPPQPHAQKFKKKAKKRPKQ